MATFYNNATLSYNGKVTTSNTVSGELVEILSATKTAVLDTYTLNGTVTYIISLINTGEDDFEDLIITDNLGAYTYGTQTLVPLTYAEGSVIYYVDGALQTTPIVTGDSPLEITGIDVPAGGNATVIYEATVNEFASPATGGTIVNTATVKGGGIAIPLEVTETVTASTAAQLRVSKALNPTTVTENDTLTYTFLIQNYGNSATVAADIINLADTFKPILKTVNATFNGTPWAFETNYDYSTETGVFSTRQGFITVPAATFVQNPTTGAWVVTPGTSTLVISGIV